MHRRPRRRRLATAPRGRLGAAGVWRQLGCRTALFAAHPACCPSGARPRSAWATPGRRATRLFTQSLQALPSTCRLRRPGSGHGWCGPPCPAAAGARCPAGRVARPGRGCPALPSPSCPPPAQLAQQRGSDNKTLAVGIGRCRRRCAASAKVGAMIDVGTGGLTLNWASAWARCWAAAPPGQCAICKPKDAAGGRARPAAAHGRGRLHALTWRWPPGARAGRTGAGTGRALAGRGHRHGGRALETS